MPILRAGHAAFFMMLLRYCYDYFAACHYAIISMLPLFRHAITIDYLLFAIVAAAIFDAALLSFAATSLRRLMPYYATLIRQNVAIAPRCYTIHTLPR